jgi:starch synthase
MHNLPSRGRLRVALVSFNFGEYCIRLASGLAQHADVLLLMPDNLVKPHIAKLDGAVRLVSLPNARIRQFGQQFRAIRTVFREIRAFAPDVIHYQGVHPWFDLAFPFLRRYPLVLTIHDFKPHPGDQRFRQPPFWIETLARLCADELIVHTQFTRELVVAALPRFAESVSVIPHIQIGDGLPPSTNKEEDHLVLFFGRIWEYKGLEYLIRAEPLITARVPDARILIAGQGEDFSRYARMMVHPDSFIVHNEYISEDRAADCFQRASVVVLPYIEASQSGVIPMAYSAGKPVVATTVGGLPEIVEDGRTGFLVSPRDAVQLADAVTRLLLDARLRRQMGQKGKSKLEAECSPGVIAQKTLDVYRRAVECFSGAPRTAVASNLPAVTSNSTGGTD